MNQPSFHVDQTCLGTMTRDIEVQSRKRERGFVLQDTRLTGGRCLSCHVGQRQHSSQLRVFAVLGQLCRVEMPTTGRMSLGNIDDRVLRTLNPIGQHDRHYSDGCQNGDADSGGAVSHGGSIGAGRQTPLERKRCLGQEALEIPAGLIGTRIIMLLEATQTLPQESLFPRDPFPILLECR